MYTLPLLNNDERKVVAQIERYFKSSQMNLKQKIINAVIIAQQDLEEHHFENQSEMLKVLQFKKILDSILQKLD